MIETNRICFLIPSVASGGIEMYVLRFLRYVQDTSNITILVRSDQKGELYEEYKSTGVQIKFLPLGYFSLLKALKHYQYYKEQNFDVVCDFNANFAGVPMLISKLLKVEKRITFYRQGSNHFKSSFFKNKVNNWMNQLVYNNATHILSNSQAAIDFFFPFRDLNDTRFQVIYNGVNINDYTLEETKDSIREDLGIPNDTFVVGHVGRLDKAKNHSTILKTFQQVQKENPNSLLVLCGRNTEKLIPQVEELGIVEKTLILNYRKDIPRILKSLDCFFFPSITEGQPNALIEAMIAGIPFVASDINSIKECIPDDLFYLLKNPLNIEALKNQIMEISKSPDCFVPKGIIDKFNSKTNFELFKNILNE